MLDLKTYLHEQGQLLEAELEAALPPEDAPPGVLHKAMRHAVLGGGKRIRPVLCMAAAFAAGAETRQALPPALAVELLHTYTLVHDDLPCMDDDDFRRGKPSCHKLFGIANAVLVGDALQSLAFELLTRLPDDPPAAVGRCVLELASAAGSMGVAGGQVDDLADHSGSPDEALILSVHQRKTAVLFKAALRMGAIAAGADADQVDRLGTYGMELGLAFQITDDLLDDADGEEDNVTCVSLYGRDGAAARGQTHLACAREAISIFPADRIEVLEAVALTIGDRQS